MVRKGRKRARVVRGRGRAVPVRRKAAGSKGGDKSRIAELERSLAELKRLVQLKDDLISDASHELRSSLASVQNVLSNAMVGVLGKPSEKMRASFEMAEEHIARFNRIVGDLLDVSRLESGRVMLDRRVQDPMVVIDSIGAAFSGDALKKGIRLSGRWRGDRPEIFWDGDRIHQVLSNLVNNAIKYTPDGGRISVEGACRSGEKGGGRMDVVISVTDTGTGVERERRESIFDRFHTTGGRSPHEGLGLGLAIARQLVTMHDGAIWVEGDEGRGATFIFSIPMYNDETIFRLSVDDYLKRAKFNRQHLALVLIELVDRKAGGFPKGKALSRRVHKAIGLELRRKQDAVVSRAPGRYALLLPETSGRQGLAVLGRVAESVLTKNWKRGAKPIHLELRAGVAAYPEDADDAGCLIKKAQERMKKV